MQGVIVGFGTIALGHAFGYADSNDMAITAVIDPVSDRRAYAERVFGLRSYETFEEMIRHEKPDFLDICAPPDVHLAYANLGLSNGMHVLCEKPVFPTTRSHELDTLLSTIGTSDATFYPAHNYKFAPILKAMDEICQSPEFGKVLSAHFRTIRAGHAVGVAEWHPHWRRDPRISGGGILMDHGPHSIYLAALLTQGTPVKVSCRADTLDRETYVDTEDTVRLNIICHNEVRIDLDLTWAADRRDTYYSVTGESGTVVVENDYLTCELHGQVTRRALRSEFDDPAHRSWFRQLFQDFQSVLKEPGRRRSLLREAWMTAAVIAAGYASAARGGTWVELAPPPVPMLALPDYERVEGAHSG